MSRLYVGTVLHGFCGGAFGRDSYSDKRIEAIGADWIVARNERGEAEFAAFKDTDEMEWFVAEYSKEE